jgi:hypothetical protein
VIGGVAAAALQKSAIATSLNVTRIIALVFIILSFQRGQQKNRVSSGKIVVTVSGNFRNIAVAPSPLGDSSKATSPASRRETTGVARTT